MSQGNSSWPLLPVVGIAVALLGVVMIGSASDSMPAMAIGTVVVLLGIASIAQNANSRWRRPATGPASVPVPSHRPTSSSSKTPDVVAQDASQTEMRSGIGVLPSGLPCESARLLSGGDFLAPTLGELSASFMRWFEQQDVGLGLWAPFDRWLRDTLHQFLHARHVRCFRMNDRDDSLASMAEHMENAFWLAGPPPALIDHVVVTGRRYVRGAIGNGQLIEQLVNEWAAELAADGESRILAEAPAWLLPIRKHNRTIGLVAVGELPDDFLRDLSALQAVGNLLQLFWCYVDQAEALKTAQHTDKISGVLNRSDLTSLAEQAMQHSSQEGEPLVIAVISAEGLRRLDDEGRWAERDWVIGQIGLAMRKKLRSDDLVGRFSDDYFVVVLRRLDISLGKLIVTKLLEGTRTALAKQSHLQHAVQLRCALLETSGEEFESALGRTFDALQQAREQQTDMVVITTSRVLSKAGT